MSNYKETSVDGKIIRAGTMTQVLLFLGIEIRLMASFKRIWSSNSDALIYK